MKSVRCMMSFGAITFSQLLNQQLEEEKRVHMESEKFLQKKFEVGETLGVWGCLKFSCAVSASFVLGESALRYLVTCWRDLTWSFLIGSHSENMWNKFKPWPFSINCAPVSCSSTSTCLFPFSPRSFNAVFLKWVARPPGGRRVSSADRT